MGRLCYDSKDAYKDVVIELSEDTKLEYMIHYAAPYTGGGKTIVPKGTRLQLNQHMNDYCFYAHTINSNLEKNLWKQENEVEGRLKGVVQVYRSLSISARSLGRQPSLSRVT